MLTEHYGKAEFEGKEYTISQPPYIEGGTDDFQRPYYTALAVDQEGNEVRLKWAIKDAYFNEDGNLRGIHDEMMEYVEEADMCDWDNPIEVSEY